MIDLTREVPVKVAELAELLGVHRRTVEAWFDRGLESVMVGRLRFTTLEALQRFAVPVSGPEFVEKWKENRSRYRTYLSAEDERQINASLAEFGLSLDGPLQRKR